MKFLKRNIILIYLEGIHDLEVSDRLYTFNNINEFLDWQKNEFIPNQQYYIENYNNVRYFQANELKI